MATGKPVWVKVAAIIALVFGIVGLVAGTWMLAPVILLAIVLLLMQPKSPST